MSGSNTKCLSRLRVVQQAYLYIDSMLQPVQSHESVVNLYPCQATLGHTSDHYATTPESNIFRWPNDSFLEYTRCPVEDPNTHEFPCEDYYRHCVHCRTMLNGKECDLEHAVARVSRDSSNGRKRVV